MITLNQKYSALFKNNTRFFVLTGGRGSAKSFAVGTFLSLLSFESKHKILFTRQTMTSAHLSIIPEFQEKINLIGKDEFFDVNKSDITNKLSGSEIIFKGIRTSSGDQTANLKSLQGVTTWALDEAEEQTEEEVFDKINLSIRQKGVQNRVILILNPSTKEHWIYKRFFEDAGVQEGFNGIKGDTTYIHTTYLDNIKHLDESFLFEVQRIKDSNPKKYKHQILGGWLDKAEGVVFTNWEFGAFNPEYLPTSFGQDYGFSIDPTTLVEVAIDKNKKIIYIKEHLYKPRLTTSQIAAINNTITNGGLIIADSAEPRLIDELVKLGNRVIPTTKGAGSISAGIAIMQDYKLIVTGDNIGKELNNYVYADKGSKLFVDDYNHCFVGETLITTNKGSVRIDEIKANDLVLTSKGFKPVVKVFNNGIKKTIEYLMHFDSFDLSLRCTENHKIKTTKGWKKVKNLTEKDTLYIQTKNTTQEGVEGCTELFGNFTMEKYKRDLISTTRMGTPSIMTFQTSRLLRQGSIKCITAKKDLQKTLNLQGHFNKLALKKRLSGTEQKRALNGISYKGNSHGQIELFMKQRNAMSVGMTTKQDTKENQGFAILTAKLNRIQGIEMQEKKVYDIMVKDQHEYFANNVLVHNCLDAVRYNVSFHLQGNSSFDIR